MTEEELQSFVEKISFESFQRPFFHKAKWNNRLKTTGGRYDLKTHDLDFNPKVLEVHGEEIFSKIIKHELCHYHLHLQGQGFQHKDSTFKQLLKQVGGLRFTPPIEEKKRLTYQCKKCGQLFFRQRKMNTKKYACGKCGGGIVKM
ncbi:SprT-like protein [Pilibacter termitis]|uniref:Protein SprT-like n=1 Tax=Pilibacter termitis TaxID=263852 RepID=A0A1T4NXU1_9ENTE|nr:SprT family protein [Pilibacter termitis]SJZ83608.1 SprT-like protein [Pilibacter termitis]